MQSLTDVTGYPTTFYPELTPFYTLDIAIQEQNKPLRFSFMTLSKSIISPKLLPLVSLSH